MFGLLKKKKNQNTKFERITQFVTIKIIVNIFTHLNAVKTRAFNKTAKQIREVKEEFKEGGGNLGETRRI